MFIFLLSLPRLTLVSSLVLLRCFRRFTIVTINCERAVWTFTVISVHCCNLIDIREWQVFYQINIARDSTAILLASLEGMFHLISYIHQWFSCCSTQAWGRFIALWILIFRDYRESSIVTKVFVVEYQQPNILFPVEDDDKNFLKDMATQVSFRTCNPLCEYNMLYI